MRKKKNFSTCHFISLPYLLRERVLHLMALSEAPLLGYLCPVSKALCQVPWADCRHRCPVHHKVYPHFGDSQGKPDWMTEACSRVLLRVAVEVDVPCRYLQLPRVGSPGERERLIQTWISRYHTHFAPTDWQARSWLPMYSLSPGQMMTKEKMAAVEVRSLATWQCTCAEICSGLI